MKIIIAGKNKRLFIPLKLLFEKEIEGEISISIVVNSRELLKQVGSGKADAVIILEPFLEEYKKVMGRIYRAYPGINIIIVSGDRNLKDERILADEILANDSPQVINNLIRLVRTKEKSIA